MSEENPPEAKTGARRPIEDQIAVRMPFLVDLAAAGVARLRPGSPLRQQLVKGVLRRGFDAVSRTDAEVALLGYEPDCEILLFGAGGLGLAEQYSGHQGWRDLLDDLYENFAEPRFTVKRVLDAGDRWVAEVEFAAQGKASGVPVVRNSGTVYYFSPRGKVARQDYFWQQDGWKLALGAAGLSE